jgi:hypothetical protein
MLLDGWLRISGMRRVRISGTYITEKKGVYVAFDQLQYTSRNCGKIEGFLPLDQHIGVRIPGGAAK